MKKLILISLLMELGGCASLKSNVKGTFACGVPGGTCAPTMTIDDGALKKIAADNSGISSPVERMGSEPSVQSDQEGYSAYPVRQARVVFPAYVDGKGRRHEPTVVNVPMNDAYVAELGTVTPTGSTMKPVSTNLVSAASAVDGTPAAVDAPLTLAKQPVVKTVQVGHWQKKAATTAPPVEAVQPSVSPPQSFPASSVAK